MQYKTIIKSPVKWGDEVEIPIRTIGDTIFVSISSKVDKSFKMKPNEEMIKVPKDYVMLVTQGHNLQSLVTEGDDITVSVSLSEAQAMDTTVTLSLTHTLDLVGSEWRRSDYNTHDDTFDVMECYSLAQDSDFSVTTLNIVIPQGSLTASSVINTVDDGVLTGGEGTYRVTKISIDSTDNPNVMIHRQRKEACILLEDKNTYPAWTQGELELYGKLVDDGLDILEFEPIETPEGGIATLEFKHDETTLEPIARSYITDDTPLDKIKIRPVTTGDGVLLPIPLDAADTTDLSLVPPHYSVVVTVGERKYGN